ncbi:MAG: SpoIIE family protein phosphatase [Tenuifilaceae bacterium]
MGFRKLVFLGINYFLLSLPLFGSAQELGLYPIRNFNHRDYSGHAQNWAIVQDHRGLIYVANNIGVVEYDGNNWRHISINGALSRCLDVDEEGRIWVGGQDEFGYLAPDSLGSIHYYSLMNMVPEYCLPIGLVRQIFATNDGIFVSSNQTLLQVKDGVVKNWKPKTFFHRTYKVAERIFTNQPGYGLTYIHNDSLKRVPNGDFFNNNLIYLMLPFDNDKLLIGTQTNGFYTYNLNAINPDTTISSDSIIVKFQTQDDKFFKENMIYNGIRLPNNIFAIGTSRKGVVFISNKGEVVRRINQSTGIQDDAIYYVFQDNQDNIWMALNNGISYSSISSQLTSWDLNSGLRGSLYSIVRYKKSLYISTNIGIFRMVDNTFKEVEGMNRFSHKLFKITTKDGNSFLLAGSMDGIFQIEGDKAHKIENCKNGAYNFYASKIFPNIIYAALEGGVGVLKYQNGRWIFIGKIEDIKGQVYSIIEDNQGFLWFSVRYKGVSRCNVVNPYQLIIDQLELFDNLPYSPKYDDMAISLIDGAVKVSTDKGLCRFDVNKEQFVPDSSLGVEFTDGETGIRILNQDSKENLWFEAYRNNPNRWIERAQKYPDKTYRRIPAQFRTIPEMIFNDVLSEENDINWIAASDGLYRYDGSTGLGNQSLIKVLIRQVVVNQSKIIFNGAFAEQSIKSIYKATNFSQSTSVVTRLRSSDNSIMIYYSSPFFGQTQYVKYSYFLEGYDKTWSEWKTDQKKEYTNLSSGTYRFFVKARNIFDTESPTVSYSFIIKRPWYQSTASYAIYALILLSIIWLVVGINTKLLKSSNIRLKLLVDERTKELIESQHAIVEKNEELMQQKEEMQVQRDELHEQNHQITASLEYAQTIQQAILPDLSVVSDRIEHFVIYRPKDVVSGDFYWMSRLSPKSKQNEKIFIAVVDCTGHGVPGAFMSMIGSRMLSEIVNERKIHNPAAILTELNKSVNQALRQDVSESFDGMDASLCLIEHKLANQYTITYAGANRAMYYYQQGIHKIQTLRGNRKTIGGIMPDVDSEFVNSRIYLNPGDMIFLNTDGIIDQNNEYRKKYTACRYHLSILESIDKPMDEIGINISLMFDEFKANAFQRDDITVLGLKLLEDSE